MIKCILLQGFETSSILKNQFMDPSYYPVRDQMILPILEKTLDKIQHFFMLKSLKKEQFPQFDKIHLQKAPHK